VSVAAEDIGVAVGDSIDDEELHGHTNYFDTPLI